MDGLDCTRWSTWHRCRGFFGIVSPMKRTKASLLEEAESYGVTLDPDQPYALILHEVKQLRESPPRARKTAKFNALGVLVWSEPND